MKYIKIKAGKFLPQKSIAQDAGYDLRSTCAEILKPSQRKLIKTGVFLEMPIGMYGRIAPRSGLALKFGIDVMGGVVDASYRGEIGVILINLSSEDFQINEGDRIAQIIFENYNNVHFIEVDSLESSERGSLGFGSSGV